MKEALGTEVMEELNIKTEDFRKSLDVDKMDYRGTTVWRKGITETEDEREKGDGCRKG